MRTTAVTDPALRRPVAHSALDPAWDGAIRMQLVRDLHERSRSAVLTMGVLLGVFAWALAPALRVDVGVRVVLGLLALVTFVRLGLALMSAERRDRLASVRTQFHVFTAGVALSALLLAALVVLSWPLLDPARIAIFAVLTSGLISGAVMSLGFSPLVYMVYMLPPVGALLVMALTDQRPPWGAGILATAFAIYGVAVFAISLDQQRTRRHAIRLRLQLEDLVVRDTLTRLHNRRFLQEFMVAQSARIARDALDLAQGRQPARDTAMGLFVMDLDGFKQVNDSHGHGAGDAVLQQSADIFMRAVRRSDDVVRWGGEEFVAVAWMKEPGHARIIAEKLRRAIEAASFALPDGGTLRRTVSVGFASMPFAVGASRMLAWEQVLALADAALYVAKTEGRNRWVGVTAGDVAWPDLDATCADVVQDLHGARARGLVQLERMADPAR